MNINDLQLGTKVHFTGSIGQGFGEVTELNLVNLPRPDAVKVHLYHDVHRWDGSWDTTDEMTLRLNPQDVEHKMTPWSEGVRDYYEDAPMDEDTSEDTYQAADTRLSDVAEGVRVRWQGALSRGLGVTAGLNSDGDKLRVILDSSHRKFRDGEWVEYNGDRCTYILDADDVASDNFSIIDADPDGDGVPSEQPELEHFVGKTMFVNGSKFRALAVGIGLSDDGRLRVQLKYPVLKRVDDQWEIVDTRRIRMDVSDITKLFTYDA